MRLGGLKYSASFFTYDPVRQYALRPGAHGWSEGEGESYVTINSDGMHDREHAVAKPNGVFRVAFLGDSETNAVHLAFEENMVQLAQKELQRDPGNVELLNFAVGGYTLPEQVYTFRDHAAKYQPDVVILMLSPAIIRSSNRELNTFDTPTPSFILQDGRLVPDPHDDRFPAPTPRRLALQNRIFQIINKVRLLSVARAAVQDGILPRIARARSWFAPKPDRPVYSGCSCGPPQTAAMEASWQISEALIAWLAETVRARHAELWIVSLGDGSQIIPDPPVRAMYEQRYGTTDLGYSDRRLGEIASRLNIPYLTLAPALLEYATQHHAALRGSGTTAPYEGHLNREGHRAAGPILAAYIRSGVAASRH